MQRVASFKVNARENVETYVIIWEFSNKDGSRGYITQAIGESDNQQAANARLEHFHGGNGDWLLIDLLDGWRSSHEPTWLDFWFAQPGIHEAVEKWLETGTIPLELEILILPGGIQRFAAP